MNIFLKLLKYIYNLFIFLKHNQKKVSALIIYNSIIPKNISNKNNLIKKLKLILNSILIALAFDLLIKIRIIFLLYIRYNLYSIINYLKA